MTLSFFEIGKAARAWLASLFAYLRKGCLKCRIFYLYSNDKAQAGNVVALILIGIGLFAFLSFTVTQSLRSAETGERERASILAADIMQYGITLESGAEFLMQSGITVSQIRASSTHANDEAELFDYRGAGVAEVDAPPAEAGTASTDYVYLNVLDPTGPGWYVTGIGVDSQAFGRDFILVATFLTDNVCAEINRGLQLASAPLSEATQVDLAIPYAAGGAGNNAGSFNAHNADPQRAACVVNGSDGNVYYHVVAAQ